VKINFYTTEEIAVITAFYKNEGATYCAGLMPGRKPSSVKQKARKLGFYYEGDKLGCFKEGHTPANKGAKMPNHVYEAAKATMFKKGFKPANTKFDGAISLRKDNSGYVYKFIRLKCAKWVQLHRYVWEQANGLIPDKHIIRFINGNTLDVRLDNLELLSMDKNAIINRHAKYPRSLQESIYQFHKLNREINAKKY